MNLRIKEICKEKNLSIGELASKIGVVRESLSRIISSGSTSTDTLERIAAALGVKVIELFEQDASSDGAFRCPKCGTRFEMKEKTDK